MGYLTPLGQHQPAFLPPDRPMAPKRVDWAAEAAEMARASHGGMRAPSSAAADSTAAVTTLRRRLRLFWRHHEKDFSEWWIGLPQDDKVGMGGRLKRRCCAEALAADMVSAIFGLSRHARSLPFWPCARVPSLRCCSCAGQFFEDHYPCPASQPRGDGSRGGRQGSAPVCSATAWWRLPGAEWGHRSRVH